MLTDKDSNILKTEGLKSTKHRREIISYIEKSEQPLSAEQIYFELKKNSSSINLSTVYRILNVLTIKKIVNKSDYDEKFLYEINKNEHSHHFICSECKRMFKIDNCPLEKYEKTIQENLGFDITGHKLEIYGLCRNCKLNNKLISNNL